MPILGIVFMLFGVLGIGNSLWMLISPETWYHNLPAAVPDTGAFNPHFIRDIGLLYGMSGAGFIWSAFRLDRCYSIHIVQTGFYAGHALLHVVDIVMGRLPQSHWLEDALGVFMPGIVLGVLCVPAVWRKANPRALGMK
jgi:hypothetical protein